MFVDEMKKADRCYYWVDDEGRHCFLNDVMGLRLKGGAPAGTEGLKAGDERMHKFLANEFDKIRTSSNMHYVPGLNLRQITEETVTIQVNGSARRVVLLSIYRAAYNSKWLKTFKRALPDGIWYIRRSKGRVSPLYAISGKGEAMLLPIRYDEKG